MATGSGFTLKATAAADIPTPAADKATIFLNSTAGEVPYYRDDAGVLHSFVGDGALTYENHGNTGATETVNATTANVHRLVLDAATVTLTFAGAPASGTPGIMRLIIVQDGTGGRLLAYPGSVSWGTPGAPTLQTGAGAVDTLDFYTVDGGTTWYGLQPGRAGATGATGVNGGAVAINYTFSTTTTDSDPGNGNLRLDNATQLSATKIRADLLDTGSTDWSAILDTLDDSTSTIKGHIRLFKTTDPTKWIVFTVSAVDSSSGYRNITVAVVGGSGANPFANSDPVTLAFARQGDQGSAGAGSSINSTCNGRLTLTTAVPVTTADVTAATTLYFTPYAGNQIGTYSGSAWSVNTFTEKSITLATLTSGLPYDCFIVDSTLALELVAWTNATTRATALVLQDGILVKSGATTRRYLGTICIAATGQSEDSAARRLVWNYYNRKPRFLKVVDTTDSWTYATATWRQARASAANQVDYVCGVLEDIVWAKVRCGQSGGAGTAGAVGVGVDSTSSTSAQIMDEITNAGGTALGGADYRGYPGIGYHFLAWVEYARAGTCTFIGDNGVADHVSGMVAEVWA